MHLIVTTMPPRPGKDRGTADGVRKEVGRQNYPRALRVSAHSLGISKEYIGLSTLCPDHLSSIFDAKDPED